MDSLFRNMEEDIGGCVHRTQEALEDRWDSRFRAPPHTNRYSSQFKKSCLAKLWSGSRRARAHRLLYHSILGSRVMQKTAGNPGYKSPPHLSGCEPSHTKVYSVFVYQSLLGNCILKYNRYSYTNVYSVSVCSSILGLRILKYTRSPYTR